MFLHDRNFDLIVDVKWREIIQQQYRCGKDAAERGDFCDSAVHLGAAIEGLLCSFVELLISDGTLQPPNKQGKQWNARVALLDDLISVLESADKLPRDIMDLVAFVKNARNTIHAGKQRREDSFFSESDIRLIVACMDRIVTAIEEHFRPERTSSVGGMKERATIAHRELNHLPFLSPTESRGPVWILSNPLECLEALVAMLSHGVHLFENAGKQVGLKRMMSTEFTNQSYEKFFHGEESKQKRLKVLLSEYKELLQRYVTVDQMFDWSIYGTVNSSSCNKSTAAFVQEMFFSQQQELSQVGADTFVNHVSLILLGVVHDKQLYHWHYGMLLLGDELFHRPYSGLLLSDERILSLLDAFYWGPIERKAFGAGSFDDTAALQEDGVKRKKLIEIIETGI